MNKKHCNIKCQYCSRKYDCMNESRPGVTSAILTPDQAIKYLERVVEKEPRITVVGIAGPGDPMANPSATLQTMNLVRKRFPDMLLCLATNGLALPAYLDELASIGVSHVTITINAVDPAVGEKVYAWARDGKVIYRGAEAAKLLIERQLASVAGLHERGIMTKVNTIVIPSRSAAAMASSSRNDPPGWMHAVTPAATAASIPSANGKNASDPITAPMDRFPARRAAR